MGKKLLTRHKLPNVIYQKKFISGLKHYRPSGVLANHAFAANSTYSYIYSHSNIILHDCQSSTLLPNPLLCPNFRLPFPASSAGLHLCSPSLCRPDRSGGRSAPWVWCGDYARYGLSPCPSVSPPAVFWLFCRYSIFHWPVEFLFD